MKRFPSIAGDGVIAGSIDWRGAIACAAGEPSETGYVFDEFSFESRCHERTRYNGPTGYRRLCAPLFGWSL
jgi:hypothetical protein